MTRIAFQQPRLTACIVGCLGFVGLLLPCLLDWLSLLPFLALETATVFLVLPLFRFLWHNASQGYAEMCLGPNERISLRRHGESFFSEPMNSKVVHLFRRYVEVLLVDESGGQKRLHITWDMVRREEFRQLRKFFIAQQQDLLSR